MDGEKVEQVGQAAARNAPKAVFRRNAWILVRGPTDLDSKEQLNDD